MPVLFDQPAQEDQPAGFAQHFGHGVERLADPPAAHELGRQVDRYGPGSLDPQHNVHGGEQRDVGQRQRYSAVHMVEQVRVSPLGHHPQARAAFTLCAQQQVAHDHRVESGRVGKIPAAPAGIVRIGRAFQPVEIRVRHGGQAERTTSSRAPAKPAGSSS
jgi:hypothetical protein